MEICLKTWLTNNEQILYVHRTHAQAMNKSCMYIEHMLTK